jgi:hypothetical protein
VTDTPASAALRSELTHRLAAYLPADAVAPVAQAAVDAWDGDATDRLASAGAIFTRAMIVVPEPYRSAAVVATAVAQAVQAWLDAPIAVQAGLVTFEDRRPAETQSE